MELRFISNFPSHISPSIWKHPNNTIIPTFFHVRISDHSCISTTTSRRPVLEAEARFNLHQRQRTLQFTSNERWTRVRATTSPMSEGKEDDKEKRDSDSESEDEKCPLSLNDEDSDWPDEEQDGWGFPLSNFFDEVRIVNKRPEDDLDYLTEDEIQWQDDSVNVPPVKGMKADDWEETVFGDIAPLVVLIFERYNRPIENMKAREELDKAINVFWDLNKPAPRAVMFDAIEESDLASSLHVKDTPVIFFFKEGKLLHRQTEILTGDELAKVMAYVFWGADQPECLKGTRLVEEIVPNLS